MGKLVEGEKRAMQMLTVASKLDWSEWLRGLIGAAVSGGAGSVAAGFAVMKFDPAHDINIFGVMGVTFAFSAAISLAKYLQMHPTPDPTAPPTSPIKVN